MKVITNHLGFRNGHAEKRLTVEDVPEARSIFGTELCRFFEIMSCGKAVVGWHDACHLDDAYLTAAQASERYDRTGGENNADHLQWRAWASLELRRCEGRDYDATAAAEALDRLLDLQVTDYVGGQSDVRGFFRSGRDDGGYHHKHVAASYPVIVAAEMI